VVGLTAEARGQAEIDESQNEDGTQEKGHGQEEQEKGAGEVGGILVDGKEKGEKGDGQEEHRPAIDAAEEDAKAVMALAFEGTKSGGRARVEEIIPARYGDQEGEGIAGVLGEHGITIGYVAGRINGA
jgi:hypothetical protein